MSVLSSAHSFLLILDPHLCQYPSLSVLPSNILLLLTFMLKTTTQVQKESLRPGHAIKLGLDTESSTFPRNVVLTSQEFSGWHQ